MWKKRMAAVRNGDFRVVELSDLKRVATLGKGAFGVVSLVQINGLTDISFALKQLKKAQVVNTNQQQQIMYEKEIIAEAQCDFIVKLYKTFKDRKYLYLLMESCLGGDLWTALNKRGPCSDDATRFYIACVVKAFEYLHSKNIAYRDLKPENLLLDSRGYLKLVDFGLAKKVPDGGRTWTRCGTPYYMAPEVLRSVGHDVGADYWSLGVLAFDLLTGMPPFIGDDDGRIYDSIMNGIDAIVFPRTMTSNAVDFIKRLCRDNPTERLRCHNGGVQRHSWFEGFNWEGLVNRTLIAPFIPEVKSSTDTSHFHKYPLYSEGAPSTYDVTDWDPDF